MRHIILDIATCPLPEAAGFLEEPSAPANYRDEAKIAAYVAEKKAEQAERCGLDPDLGRISAIGHLVVGEADYPTITRCKTEGDERLALTGLLSFLRPSQQKFCHLIGYNALKFDWPFLVRRALYLGVPLAINTDRFKSPHIDLADKLTHRGLLPMRSLGFYVRRLGWTDIVKPLSGAEEAKAPAEGRWDELEASVRHDVIATYRLATWMGVLQTQDERDEVLA